MLKEKVALAPRCAGVYLMKDAAGKIIYIGKANDLKSRVNSYFTGKDTRPMAPFLLSRISDIEFINTATEKEALILENNLIKQHHPRYNVIMRDDKTYYHLCLDPDEYFPRLQLVRRMQNKRARYFGPYPSGGAAKEALRFVLSIFPLRTCRDRDFQLRRRPCLEYQIRRCPAPCAQLIDEDGYNKLVIGALAFLGGHGRRLIADLKTSMDEAAEKLHYEEAARLRDRIAALNHVLEKQNVAWTAGRDQDVFGVYETAGHFQLCLLFVRGGKLLGKKSLAPVKSPADMAEVLSAVIRQYYDGGADIPPEVIVPLNLPDAAIIAEWLSDKKGMKVGLAVPVRGDKKNLLELAQNNARSIWEQEHKKDEQKTGALKILQEKLLLKNLPRRIECYDISNIGGSHAVGSMVVLQDGEPDKSGYRRFRIRTVRGADDYAMMREVLSRRFARSEELPDLIVVDGGKGQLNIALAVLKELQIDIGAVGLAKEGRSLPGRGSSADKSADRVFLPKRKNPLFLLRWPHALALLQRVRDEAHRFAVAYHRRLKEKYDLMSVLDNIPDIGAERRKSLLKHFEAVSRIGQATCAELQQVEGIGRELAEKIHAYFSVRGHEREGHE
ncbi:MAG TPA: excinuclease ABC subunit UvrC [Smithellaceae bacterium]|nr:excinuclease ABC subunit UvrC [Smithellaceae bacterium]